MLRSIVAVWTVAFALLVAAVFLGCGGDDSCGWDHSGDVTPATPTPAPPDLGESCAQACPVCAGADICIQGSATSQLPSFCAHACADDRDCGEGETCGVLFGSLQPAVCVSRAAPVGCSAPSPTWHCDFPGPSCSDESTLQQPFSFSENRICGWALVHCVQGCVGEAGAAHCA